MLTELSDTSGTGEIGGGDPNVPAEGDLYKRQRDELLAAIDKHRDTLDHAAIGGPPLSVGEPSRDKGREALRG